MANNVVECEQRGRAARQGTAVHRAADRHQLPVGRRGRRGRWGGLSRAACRAGRGGAATVPRVHRRLAHLLVTGIITASVGRRGTIHVHPRFRVRVVA